MVAELDDDMSFENMHPMVAPKQELKFKSKMAQGCNTQTMIKETEDLNGYRHGMMALVQIPTRTANKYHGG